MIPHIFIFGYNTKTKRSFQIDQRNLFNEDIYTDDIQDEIAQLYAEIDEIYKEDPSNTKEMSRLQKKINVLASQKYEIENIRLVAMRSK
jgi:peptidoglycan hydrolase CwlO-like protein